MRSYFKDGDGIIRQQFWCKGKKTYINLSVSGHYLSFMNWFV